MKLELFIQIILLFVGVYLAFFKSYLTEKGKSAALKEDLSELTKEVETVKDEFIKEQALLKTDLQRILDNEISYREQERSALIQYHGILNEWVYSINEVGFGDYSRTNIDMLIDVKKRNSSFYAKAGISKSKIMLLVEDDELVKIANELYSEVLKYHHWTDAEFLKLKHNLERHKSLTDQFLIIMKNWEENKELGESLAKDEKILEKEKKELFDNYYENRNTELAKTYPLDKKFTKLVKKYLKN